jgi:hypothetical protein
VSRIELNRSSDTLGGGGGGGADVVDKVDIVEGGVDVAFDEVGVDECVEQPASDTATTPTAANRMPPARIRFDR